MAGAAGAGLTGTGLAAAAGFDLAAALREFGDGVQEQPQRVQNSRGKFAFGKYAAVGAGLQGDVRDAPAALGDHCGKRCLAAMKHRVEIRRPRQPA